MPETEADELDFDDLTIAEVVSMSVARCRRWHPPETEGWSGADWSNAMCGEAGEAANVVKKIRRHETGLAGLGLPLPPLDELHADLALELADVFLYVVLVADHYDVDLPRAIVEKFNAVSERQGFPERLPASAMPELCIWCSKELGPANRTVTNDDELIHRYPCVGQLVADNRRIEEAADG